MAREARTRTALPPSRLPRRERQVFDLLGEGLSHSEIAERLDISPKTVETYTARIRERLDLGESRYAVHDAAVEARVLREHGITGGTV